MATTEPVALPALDNTFGAMFIGVVVAATLFGVSCVQVWFYYTKYQKDPFYLKLLVAVVFCSDMTHQILISHTMYTYVITNFANPMALITIVWSLIVEVIVNGITALLVQSFFVYRIWMLSNKSVLLTGGTALLVIAEFVIVLKYCIHAFQLDTLLDIGKVKTESQLINIFGALGDVVIAAAMVTLLHRSRTGFKQSDGMINRLIKFVVNTGLLTSICAICSLISVLAAPNAYIYICFFFTLGRLYSNSLFATLNARRSTRNINGESIPLSLDASSTGSRTARGTVPHSLAAKAHDISINIEQTTEYSRDAELKQDLDMKADTFRRGIA